MVLNQFNTNFWDSRNLFDKFHNRELGHFVVKVSFSIGSNTTTAKSTKTSLKKGIHVLSISITIFPTSLLCQMKVNSSGFEFERIISEFRNRKKLSSSLVYVLHKT